MYRLEPRKRSRVVQTIEFAQNPLRPLRVHLALTGESIVLVGDFGGGPSELPDEFRPGEKSRSDLDGGRGV